MKLGYIINDNHPLFDTIELSDIPKFLGLAPILIVGAEKALEYNPSLNLTEFVIDIENNISYIFSNTESDEYEQQINNYISTLFKKFVSNYNIIDVSKNIHNIKIQNTVCFFYETNTFITFTTTDTIYYFNKEIYHFFSQIKIDSKTLIKTIQDNNNVKILSWNHNPFFPAYLKTINQYIPLESLKAVFKSYGDINLYLGAICIKWYFDIIPQIKDFKQLSLWQRAYNVETQLSTLKIKINVKKLENFEEENTLLESMYNSLQNGYIVQKYNGTDKVTGRMYVKDSSFSIQTLAEKYKDLVIAEKGCYLIEFDYDYFEYFLLSQLYDIPLHGDPHISMSKLIWGDEKHRAQGKTINYAIIYGQNITKAVDQLDIDNKIEVIEKLQEILAPLEPVKKTLHNEYKKKGYITNHFGRIIYPEKEFALLNNFLQSTATDYVIIKLEKLFELLKTYSPENKIVLQNHDSILLNLNINVIEETNIAEEIKTLLEEKEEGIYGTTTLSYGKDWKNME